MISLSTYTYSEFLASFWKITFYSQEGECYFSILPPVAFLPILSLSRITPVTQKSRKSVKGWGEALEPARFFPGPLSCHLKNTAQVNEVSSLHNGGYIFTLMLWPFSCSSSFTLRGGIPLLCFWTLPVFYYQKRGPSNCSRIFLVGPSFASCLINPVGIRSTLSPADLWAKGCGPFKPPVCAERGTDVGRALWQRALGPAPGGGVSQRPAAPMLPPARHSCWFCSDLRAPTSPCPGSVSVKLQVRVKHLVPMPEVLVDSPGTFLAYQRLRRWKSINNAGCKALKPGASALLLGGDSGPRVRVWICSGWLVLTTRLCSSLVLTWSERIAFTLL